MGTYTALNLTIRLNDARMAEWLVQRLDPNRHHDISDGGAYDSTHPLFACERWRHLLTPFGGTGEEFRRVERPASRIMPVANGRWLLQLRSSLKDYDDEINKLLSWLTPAVCDVVAERRYGWISSRDSDCHYDVIWRNHQLMAANYRDGNHDDDDGDPYPSDFEPPKGIVA